MWSINNIPLKDIGNPALRWTETSAQTDTLNLAFSVQYYHADVEASLIKNAVAIIKHNDEIMFQGQITKLYRSMESAAESINLQISGPWFDLDNRTYRQNRNYSAGTQKSGSTILGRETDEATTGQRNQKVIADAVTDGANIQLGTIDPGVNKDTTTHLNQTHGQILRDHLRSDSEQVAYLDYSTTPPTLNIRHRANLSHRIIDVNTGIKNHNIEAIETDIRGVEISYEQADGSVITQSAGESTGPGILRKTIPIDGGSHKIGGASLQVETAEVECRDIPEHQTATDEVKKWWIKHLPQLSILQKKIGEAALLGLLKIPTVDIPAIGIKAHTLILPPLTDEPPAPLNPNAVPLVHTEDLDDYPRELLSTLPKWLKKRARKLDAAITIGIEIDALNAHAEKKELEKIFKTLRFFNGKVHAVIQPTTEVTGTNARNHTYSRVISYNNGLTPPEDLAEALFDNLSQTRHRGSFTIVEQDITKKFKVGDAVSFIGGRPEWEDMRECVHSCSYDVTPGYTTVNFGPIPHLIDGKPDLIGQLASLNRNPPNNGRKPDDTPSEDATIGGTSVTPNQSTVIPSADQPAQSHYFGPLRVIPKDYGAFIDLVPTYFYEFTHAGSVLHNPVINGSPSVAAAPVRLDLPPGNHNLYAEFTVDGLRKITSSTVEIKITTAAVPESDIPVPPTEGGSPAEGASPQTYTIRKHIGTYSIPATDDVIYQPVSSPSWESFDRKTLNLGTGAKIHQETTNTEHRFRSLKGTTGSAPSGNTRPVHIAVTQNTNEIAFSALMNIDGLGGGYTPPAGVKTGDFKFKRLNGTDIKTLEFEAGMLVDGVPADIIIQTALKGDDFLYVDNANHLIGLLNANAANIKPARGTMGVYLYYAVVAGEVGGAGIFSTDPTALALDANGNPTQTPSDVITQSTNAQSANNPPVTETT